MGLTIVQLSGSPWHLPRQYGDFYHTNFQLVVRTKNTHAPLLKESRMHTICAEVPQSCLLLLAR